MPNFHVLWTTMGANYNDPAFQAEAIKGHARIGIPAKDVLFAPVSYGAAAGVPWGYLKNA